MSLVAFCGQEKKQLPSDGFQNGEIAWTFQRVTVRHNHCSQGRHSVSV